MIVVTGAAGFIGSCLIGKLNYEGFKDIVAVDDFSVPQKNNNFSQKIITYRIHRNDFIAWLKENHHFVEFVFHLGAKTDTTEFNVELFNRLNLGYSKSVWNVCTEFGIPLVYASSAATYGDGTLGYDDNHELPELLKPLNPYGESKNDFDKWVLQQENKPGFWTGLKFFNVYGPNEYHKGRMASIVFHAYKQITAMGAVKLFCSHRSGYKDGEQMRDFVYVKDVVNVCCFLMHHRKNSGLYNIGTGKARSFVDLVNGLFKAMNVPSDISFIDIPQDIRDKYQYYTQANISKLRNIGYTAPFFSIEEGIGDYVKYYLSENKYA